MGHAKGESGDDLSESNHEWNILRFNKVYYQMDSTWGAGYVKGNNFIKKLCEFYFCPLPDRLIATHHPDEDEWELLYPFVSLQEFGRIVNYNSTFYQ
jgi:transglutaminase/protease-like cytokinesis protein 3